METAHVLLDWGHSLSPPEEPQLCIPRWDVAALPSESSRSSSRTRLVTVTAQPKGLSLLPRALLPSAFLTSHPCSSSSRCISGLVSA